MTVEQKEALKPGLETPPPRIARLPVARGYPVPWFVAWVDGQPEFRAMDPEKLVRAVREKLCWVCGDKLGVHMTFVLGPMCGINRTSAEPPCHLECARYSAKNCPFLSKPHMVRREDEVTELGSHAGVMLKRNPGVTLLWTTRGYRTYRDGNRGYLFQVGDPEGVEWWAEGKPAVRAQVVASVESGLPLIEEIARQEEGALKELERRKAWLEKIYPS